MLCWPERGPHGTLNAHFLTGPLRSHKICLMTSRTDKMEPISYEDAEAALKNMALNVHQRMEIHMRFVMNHYNSTNRAAKISGNCQYAPIDDYSLGCAIGIFIPNKQCVVFDARINGGVTAIYEELPEHMKALPVVFLSRMQHLHDIGDNWDRNGITQRGLDACYEIYYEHINPKFL